MLKFILLLLCSLLFAAEGKDKLVWDTQDLQATDSLSTSKNNRLEEVNILGESELLSPHIWLGEMDLDGNDPVREQIEAKDFASDPYYMQNIDREEFEQERILLRFKDKEKKRKRGVAVFRQHLEDK